MPEVREVLPVEPVPTHYDLTIRPNYNTWKFDGRVAIDLTATNDVQEILCNAVELSIQKAEVFVLDATPVASTDRLAKAQKVEVANIEYRESTGRVNFTLARAVQGPSRLVLVLEYVGTVGTNLCGYYQAKFKDGEGKQQALGTTQFEAVDARRALPCWDEPAVKATFAVGLNVLATDVALSNTEEVSRMALSGDDEGRVLVRFAPTPKMSTYLLAWTHGQLSYIEKTITKTHATDQHTVVRVYSYKDDVNKSGAFALEVATKCLPLYEKFFGSDYPLTKCDLVAIPDFAAGAMENWGLVTYRDTALLLKPQYSEAERAIVAIIVAHELAHQWFGNIVTMQWWRELWLNEAFATWVEYWAIEALYPEMDIWSRFLLADVPSAFRLDGMLSSHPIEVDISVAEEVDSVFDAISYTKGCCVLRMVVEYIGIDAFQKGVSAYLKRFEYNNATTVDLWKYLSDASGQELAPLLEAWTANQGYPWLEASVMDDTAEKKRTLRLEQHRCLLSGSVSEEHDTLWRIPLRVLVGAADNTTKAHSLVVEGRVFEWTLPAEATWVRVNINGGSFCRVLQTPSTNLTQAFQCNALSPYDRLSVVADTTALFLGGQVPLADVIHQLHRLANEDAPAVITAISATDGTLRSLLPADTPEVKGRYNSFAQSLYKSFVEARGFLSAAADNAPLKQARAQSLYQLAKAQDVAASSLVTKLWEDRDAAPIPADLVRTVFSAAVLLLGQPAFDALLSLHREKGDERALAALTCTEDAALLRKAKDYALSENVRAQDCGTVLGGLTGSTAGDALFAEMMETQWDAISDRLPVMLRGRLLQSQSAILTKEPLERVTTVIKALPQAAYTAVARDFEQGNEKARLAQGMRCKYQGQFAEVLPRTG